jgi:hypothetical protein
MTGQLIALGLLDAALIMGLVAVWLARGLRR